MNSDEEKEVENIDINNEDDNSTRPVELTSSAPIEIELSHSSSITNRGEKMVSKDFSDDNRGSIDSEEKRRVKFSPIFIPPPITIGGDNSGQLHSNSLEADSRSPQYDFNSSNYRIPSGSAKMNPKARRFARNTSWVGHRFGGTPRAANSTPRTPQTVTPRTRAYQKLDQLEIKAAEEAETNDYATADIEIPREGKRVIMFKRAKKYPHQQMMELTKNLKRSRFQNWTRQELIRLLINNLIELRNEEGLELVALRDMCDHLYETLPTPDKPYIPTMTEMVLQVVMARRIQNFWITYSFFKRKEREEELPDELINKLTRGVDAHLEYHMSNPNITVDLDIVTQEGTINFEEFRDRRYFHNDLLSDNTTDESSTNNAVQQTQFHNDANCCSALQELQGDENENTKTDDIIQSGFDQSIKFETSTLHSEAKKREKKKLNVLDVEWVEPNPTKALHYADYNHPRRGGKGGSMFDYFTTTTGRHCCLGSFGEQFDLWGEGSISEFGIYGSGVTNYFKFLKWCYWLFAILAILSLPMLTLNIFGPNNSNYGMKALAKTTLGNLASNVINGTIDVHVPGCYNYDLYDFSCQLNRKTLGKFYSYMDIVISGAIIIGLIWLKYFEKNEEESLDKNTVTASMYSVVVTNLPEDCTEEEVAEHFMKVLGENHKVFSVSIAFDNVDEIKACQDRGHIIKEKIRSVHKHRHDSTMLRRQESNVDSADKAIQRLVNDLETKMTRLNNQLKYQEKRLEELSHAPANAIYAFVTFHKVLSRNIALHTYNKMSFLQYICMSEDLLFKGKRIHLMEAPEPSTIIWENLGYSTSNRSGRRMLTTLLTLLFVIFSLIIIFGSKILQTRAFSTNNSAETLCPSDFGSYSTTEQQEYITTYPDATHCYCDQKSTFVQARDSYCKSYLRKNINAQILTYFASLVVLMVNVFIENSLRFFSQYEKHISEDAKGESIFLRVFALKYINTCCVFFINNNSVILSKVFGYQYATSTEFTADWFNTIGVTVILVQIGDVFAAHTNKIVRLFLHYRNKKYHHALTQDELNKIYLGPKLEFALNYAQLLSTIFVCLTFSTGIPVLYLIAAGNFLLFYIVEKYLFMKMYRIPPHFNNKIGKRVSSLIPLALAVHLAIALWVLSNSELFNVSEQSSTAHTVTSGFFGSSIRKKVTGKTTFPLFVFLCVLVFGLFILELLKSFWFGAIKFFRCCCGELCAKAIGRDDFKGTGAKAIVSYHRAVQRNLIKGLATYNILQNPKYKESFAITWKFAFEHSKVRSVRNLKTKAHQAEEEGDAVRAEQLQRDALLESTKKRKKKFDQQRQEAEEAKRIEEIYNNNENNNGHNKKRLLTRKGDVRNRSFHQSLIGDDWNPR
eukprot:gene11217-15051_t